MPGGGATHVPQDLAALQLLAAQVEPQYLASQPAGRSQHLGPGEPFLPDCGQDLAAEDHRTFAALDAHRPLLHAVFIIRAGGQRFLRPAIMIEIHRIAKYAQQGEFEAPQLGRHLPLAGELDNCPGIDSVHRRLRIVAVQEIQEQLVQVITRQQRVAGKGHRVAVQLRAGERPQVGADVPGQPQRQERPQQASQFRFCGPAAARYQRQAAVLAAEYVQDAARIAKRAVMQQERLLPVYASVCGHRRSRGIRQEDS